MSCGYNVSTDSRTQTQPLALLLSQPRELMMDDFSPRGLQHPSSEVDNHRKLGDDRK